MQETPQNTCHSLPRHVAIIMDGNGRWAVGRGLPRSMGHKAGVDATRRAVKAAGEMGLEYLTLFGFSSENWARPEGEISDLMGLLRLYLRAEAAELHKNNVRLRVIGRRDRLADDIVKMIENVEGLSASNTGLQLTIALDYGGRQDIVQAVNAVMATGVAAGDVTDAMIEAHLYTAALPAPDLMLRTSGEQRISNFLLWQGAYAELYFDSVLWPDFTGEHLQQAIACYGGRKRRFGGVDAPKTTQQQSV